MKTTTTIVPASVVDAESDLAALATAASDEPECPVADVETVHPASVVAVTSAELVAFDTVAVDDTPTTPYSPRCIVSDLT
jgi:hypothetical protein